MTFEFEGYISGDFECFCIDAGRPHPSGDKRTWEQKDADRTYPGTWFLHLDDNKKYRFRLTLEAEEIA